MEKLFRLDLHNRLKMETVEQAYEKLADYALAFVDGRAWDGVECNYKILNKMATCDHHFFKGNETENQGGFTSSSSAIWDGLEAAIFLRDDLLKTTGQRIWGLIFTLRPNGKMNIEYSYDKPDDYEETDDLLGQ
jgi:hypothetical protein